MDGPSGHALFRLQEIFGPYSPEGIFAAETSLLVIRKYLENPPNTKEYLGELASRAKSTLGEAHPQAISTYISLGNGMIEEGYGKSAVELLKGVLKVSSIALGDRHPVTLRAERSLAVTLLRVNDQEGALVARGRAVEKFERVWGECHPETLNFLTALGMELLGIQEYAAAREMFRIILERKRRSLGDEHLYTLSSMGDLAFSNFCLENWTAARDLYMAALETEKRLLGPESPKALSTMLYLGYAHVALGEFGKARELFSELAALTRDAVGPDHPRTLEAMDALANVMLRLGEKSAAESMLQEVMEARGRAPAAKGRTKEIPAYSIAALMLKGDPIAAKEHFKTVAKIQRRALGASHSATLNALIGAATAAREQGRPGGAKRSLTDALEKAVRAGGLDTYWTSAIACHMSGICAILEEHGEAIFHAKLAVSSCLRARRDRTCVLDESLRKIYPQMIEIICRQLLSWLERDGRAKEADIARRILKAGGVAGPFLAAGAPEVDVSAAEGAGEGIPGGFPADVPLEAAPLPELFVGVPEEAAYRVLSSAAAACTRLGSEREALKAKREEGGLTPREKKRLSKLNAEAKAAKLTFIETCGKIGGLLKPQVPLN
jgi:tetratricopeptide (TPR) repeat protein